VISHVCRRGKASDGSGVIAGTQILKADYNFRAGTVKAEADVARQFWDRAVVEKYGLSFLIGRCAPSHYDNGFREKSAVPHFRAFPAIVVASWPQVPMRTHIARSDMSADYGSPIVFAFRVNESRV
jgi:hypothetical protein